MGWNSANEIVDSQIELMVKAVSNDEMPEALAYEALTKLIQNCQEGDWDTEDETLELFLHVPWVVQAFAQCGVDAHGDDRPDHEAVKRAIINAMQANVESFHDLSESFAQNVHAEAIASAVEALFPDEDA